LDVGCGEGGFAAVVARELPGLKVTGFDLIDVQDYFMGFMKSAGIPDDRVEFVVGDFFEDKPFPAADVVVMGRVLHNWDLDQKKALVAKAFAALPAGGAFVVYETFIDDHRRDLAGLFVSLNMLVETQGGFDVQTKDCEEWMRQAGFRETRVVTLAAPDSMVIGIK
jgi:SAM-dependent methyltransferase